MGILGTILGNGEPNPEKFFNGIQGDIYENLVTQSLDDSLLDTVSEALDALGDDAPKATEEDTGILRKAEKEDFKKRYECAVDNVAKTLSELRADIQQTTYSKFRDLYIDIIKEFCFGDFDHGFLKEKTTILKSGDMTIRGLNAQIEYAIADLKNKDISDISRELKEESREKNAYEVGIEELAILDQTLLNLISLKRNTNLDDLYAELEEKLGKYSIDEVKELLARRKATESVNSIHDNTIPNPAIDKLLEIKSKVEQLFGSRLSVDKLYIAKDMVRYLADIDKRVDNPVLLVKEIQHIIQIKNSLARSKEELRSFEEKYKASPGEVKGILERFYTVPEDIVQLFSKMKRIYQSTDDEKEALDMLMHFTKALCLPFRGKVYVSNPAKLHYVDTISLLMKKGKTSEEVNEFACKANDILKIKFGGKVDDFTLHHAANSASAAIQGKSYTLVLRPELGDGGFR